jgi:threonine/homoserine efflux transporter RhtA
MKTSAISNILMLAGVGVYFGPQIASSLFPLAQEAHVVGAVALVGGLVVCALSHQEKT